MTNDEHFKTWIETIETPNGDPWLVRFRDKAVQSKGS